eukprot:SAG31_NODE_2267_length_6052_cov_7.222241_3_plen_162_part_00
MYTDNIEELGNFMADVLAKMDQAQARASKSGPARNRSELFQQLPDKKEYPDYYVLIARPIAFCTIDQRVNKGLYSAVTDFERDVRLVFANAREYNIPGSSIVQDADYLEKKIFEPRLAVYMKTRALARPVRSERGAPNPRNASATMAASDDDNNRLEPTHS